MTILPTAPVTPSVPLWRRVLTAPVYFWTRPVRAEPLALFRIVFGATLLLSVLISYAPTSASTWATTRCCRRDRWTTG